MKVGRGRSWVWLVGVALAGAGQVAGDESSACLVCHSNHDFQVREADGRVRSLFVDPEPFFKSVHQQKGCLGCHGNLGAGPHQPPQMPPLEGEWRQILGGQPTAEKAATAACIRCHPAEAKLYAQSIHAQLAAQGNRDVPFCHNCHGNHYIDKRTDLESSVNPRNVPATCAKCHANALVMAKYDIKRNVVQTFTTSFHGEKRKLGDQQAAVCTSCHQTHDIRAPQDPLSSVNPANVGATCGKCHAGADERFARSFTHTVPAAATAPLIFWVSKFYQLMIVLTIGGMLGYCLLDWRRRRQDGKH